MGPGGRKGHLMRRVRLIHWKPEEAQVRMAQLEAAGYHAEFSPLPPQDLFRRLKSDPPEAIVIDLTRMPSHGREVAIALRRAKATRHVPIVFAEGDPEKVARIRALLPDAVYTPWNRIRSALKRAIAKPPAVPLSPPQMMERYAATPLVKKLGIKSGKAVALIDAPRSFEQTLGALPEGATLDDGLSARFDLAIWFVRSADDLRRGIGRMSARIGGSTLWVAWPKKTSGIATDLTQQLVRETGLQMGLVDYKICAIDATWSGLAFVRRKV